MAISLVNQATASSKTSSTTLTITVPTGGFPAGSTLIVLVAWLLTGPSISSITDSAGNTYVRDNTQTIYLNGITAVWRSSNILGLSAGQTITITFSQSVTAKVANVSCWTGLASNPLDKTRSNSSSGSNYVNSDLTSTTTQADELVIGPAALNGPTGDTFTPDSGLTALDRVGTSGGTATSNVTLNSLYKIVNAVGQYSIGGTNSSSRSWGAIVVTYKAALPRGRSSGYIF
jgi:hypothetical protein